MTIPGFPDNVIPLAYRRAVEGEHWFEPSGSDEPGTLYPGPSRDVVLVVAADSGHSLRYDVSTDTTQVVKEEPLIKQEQADILPDIRLIPLRAHGFHNFTEISAKLLNGTAARAARATWHPSRYITFNAANAPHFTTEQHRPWAFRSDDLRARDWVVLDESATVPVAPISA